MDLQKKYALDPSELEKMAEMGDVEIEFGTEKDDDGFDGFNNHNERDNDFPSTLPNDYVFPKDETEELLQVIISEAFGDPYVFDDFVTHHKQEIIAASRVNKNIAQAVEYGYRLGIMQGSGLCANNLGALYYMGELFEQDYEKAEELYQIASGYGYIQAIINLGYIYEYGRTGKRDYQKAFNQYALAAVLSDSSEAVYKLGDMYSYGKAVEKNTQTAKALWAHSLDLAKEINEKAQPAIRIAQSMLDEYESGDYPEADLNFILYLFQAAEQGLRIDIDNGLDYYSKRLAQAIEGQEKVRSYLDRTWEF